MAKSKPTKKDIARVKEYITAHGAGLSKYKALKVAGYSDSTARIPQRVDNSVSYSIAMQEIVKQNSAIMGMSLEAFNKRVADGELSATTMKDHADILAKLANIHDRLSPKVKLEQDGQGNVKATKWITSQDNT